MPILSSPTPLVSIVMPAYNVAHYMGEALESVRAQTYRHYEIIVVDDGSTDDTANVAQSKGDVRYFRQENKGCGAARNMGIAEACGELLAFLDADDLWSPDKLGKQVEFFQSLPAADKPTLIYGHVKQFFSPEIDESNWANIRLPDHAQPAHLAGTLLASIVDFKSVGAFESILGESIDWHLRSVEMGANIHMMPDVMLFRRIHNTNMSRAQEYDKRQYVRSLKASLDRRRQMAAKGKEDIA